MSRKLRMGMIGGGTGSFIGDVHRKASSIDGMIELVCGAFSSSAEKSIASGKALFLPEDRCYGSFEDMILKEKALPVSERMDFVAIVTPNHMHFPPAKLALESGFHVVCDKPMTLTLDEAIALEKIVAKSGKLFALTHNYTGHPLVKQAKAMVAKGDLGEIRKIQVQYLQGWLSTAVEKTGQKQASWRMDPKKSGIGGALGDIGTHAENLVEYITGLKIDELAADLGRFGDGRILDDDGNLLLRMENGAKGTMSISQIALGEENNLAIKVYGEKGSLEWHQENPNQLITRWLEQPVKVFTPNGNDLYDEALNVSRIPAGHPEGYLEAFATIYKNFAIHLMAVLDGKTIEKPDYPTVKDGVRGMKFIYAAVESDKHNAAWTKFNE
ncbi:MAG: Gfo/Idh/MocA family oxidoreductase [Algibacter sp.]|uniref:Gfo/Idh/MocA family protein n=1 Tax=Algibacter sp. TaxID=1872428 RepID=UPI002624599E|nr:Gfo/Idh/MocA family oxidoreductase [Algibacter sp.]MDG1728417.1 Gfo/Idh/MocA family oxidoreductase [Algibacter sp.]MDG2178103.1 Gfo/Idh/MocA family oxidoreductase [Algibacter sp.]